MSDYVIFFFFPQVPPDGDRVLPVLCGRASLPLL